MTMFSKEKNPSKCQNPNPTGNSVHGKMKPVKKEMCSKMGLTRTGDHSANQGKQSVSWGRKELISSNGTHIPITATQVFDHAMIHQGLGFTYSENHAGILSAGTVDLLLVTGDKPVHMRVLKVSSTGSPISALYYEDAVTSAQGTAEAIGNNNRTSTKTSECTLTSTPTVTDVGNLMGADIYPSQGGGQSGSSGTLAGGEWILKAGTQYLIRFTNDDNSASDIAINMFWYEPDNRT